MTGLIPDVRDNQRFTQRQAAKILEVSYKTIRNYENNGMMAPGRPIGKYRFYYGRDIKRCWKNFFNQPIF